MTEREMLESMAATGNRHIRTVYVAGKVTARERLKKYRGDIRYLGFKCTSSWLDFATDYPSDFSLATSHPANVFVEMTRDLEELRAADLVIMDTQDVSKTGGREFEAGFAFGRAARLWIVGPVRNIFHLVAHRRFDTWDEAVAAVKELGSGSTV